MANKKGYGQFCPVAKAAEIVAERWTPLVLRELIAGSHRFNEMHRGVPLMSTALLSQRLRELVDAGVIERRPGEVRGWEYFLTEAGEDLRPIIESLGFWGARWARGRLRQGDYDPGLLMWDIRRNIDQARLPEERTVVQFDLGGAPRAMRRWWLVFDGGDVDLCMKDPGHDVNLYLTAGVRTLADVWMGYIPMVTAMRAGQLEFLGPSRLASAFRKSLKLSVFARA